MTHAAYYSATLTYLNAVKTAKTTDSDKVMAELHKTKIDDMFTSNGKIRADRLMEHEMYVMQVKAPAESKHPWDYPLHEDRAWNFSALVGLISCLPKEAKDVR